MLTIDGSFGEGGGQILRSSVSLAAVTQTPVRLENIRAGRRKPGLMRQHLTAVRAAAEVSGGSLEGDEIGSCNLTFRPGSVRAGDYRFSIGTAGSTTLVLQTVLPPLLLASGPSTVVLEGGTHNPNAPPFDFVDKAFVPLLRRMGAKVSIALERPGFYPAGGGRLRVEVVPPPDGLQRVDILERGKSTGRRGRAIVANLPRHIAERELKVLQKRLGWPRECLSVEEVDGSNGPGNVVLIELEFESVCEVFTAFGQLRRPAEAVANDAVRQWRSYHKGQAPLGEHLTDQVLLPMALAGAGSFRSNGISLHATTHIELIRKFLDIPISEESVDGGDVVVTVGS
jgi:RNA 3'-terminal phosphate cyclase (ATP)